MASVKNVTSYSKRFFFFLKVFKSISMHAKFQVNKLQFPIQKKYDEGNLTPILRPVLRG